MGIMNAMDACVVGRRLDFRHISKSPFTSAEIG